MIKNFDIGRTKKIANILKEDMAEKGLELYDLKLEFGIVDGEVTLIDEISAGIFRVFKGDTWLQPLELAQYYK